MSMIQSALPLVPRVVAENKPAILPILCDARFTNHAVVLPRPVRLETEGLFPFEALVLSTAKEKSTAYARDHIVLVWPDTMRVNWYRESNVKNGAQLADWIERCYCLNIGWLNMDPNLLRNTGKGTGCRARLAFVHNGMRDFNYGGGLLRPVIGLRDFVGVGTEDWFGWLAHEISHEFLVMFPEVTGTVEDNAWHEALADYLRYWILNASGMSAAAECWRQTLRNAPPHDMYKGGANAIMAFHNCHACETPADLWGMLRGKGLSQTFGRPPWPIPVSGQSLVSQ